jgi:hypothetical protein
LTLSIFSDLHQAYRALLFDSSSSLSFVYVPLVFLAYITHCRGEVIPYQREIPLVSLRWDAEPSSKELLGSQKYQYRCLNRNN